MLDFEAGHNAGNQGSILSEIMHLVDMRPGVTSEGWSAETARLFAIDIAMMVLRRNTLVLAEVDRQNLAYQLQEARTLVVAGRDSELGFIQAALETHLGLPDTIQERRLWLTAIDALVPSPFRAALIATKNAITLGTTEAVADFTTLMRDRLLARLDEGSLHTEPGPTLFLTA